MRLANLRSRGLDMIEQVAANDLDRVREDPRLKLAAMNGLGYSGISINVANGERSKTPLGQDARVRQALERVHFAGELIGVAVPAVGVEDERVLGRELARALLPAIDEVDLGEQLAAAVPP